MTDFTQTFDEKFKAAQAQVAHKADGRQNPNLDTRAAPSDPASTRLRDDATATIISRCAADIAPKKIEWLWAGRLARGKHTCIAGEPGTGKSQLSIAIVAALTTASEWPCGEGQAPLGSAIILSAEDGVADTIIPRLEVAGADRARVHVVSAVCNANGSRRALDLRNDLDLLERKIAEIGDVALVVIDPVSSYLGKTDSHKNSEVRSVLEPLSEMADRMRVAVLSVTHFSKAGASNTTKALHRFIGSIAFTGAPRAAFAVIEDTEHDGRRLFLHAKNNLARPPQGLAFRLEQCLIGDDIAASRVVWDADPVTITANQALAAEAACGESRTAKTEAMEFLGQELAQGPLPMSDIKDAAEGAGLSWAAVRRAKKALGIRSSKSSMEGGWLWELPPKVLKFTEDAHVGEVSTFGKSEHLQGKSNGKSTADEGRLDIPDFLDRRPEERQ